MKTSNLKVVLRFCYPILFLFFIQSLSGQVLLNHPANLSSFFTAGQTTTLQRAGAIGGNPAGLVHVDNWSGGFFADQSYLQKELASYHLGLATSTIAGSFGLQLAHFGFASFNEQLAQLSYGRKLAPNFDVGAQFNYYQLDFQEYGRKQVFTFGLGAQAKLHPDLSMGFHVVNPIRSSLLDEGDLPAFLALGLNYQAGNQIKVMGELRKDLAHPLEFRMALVYAPISSLEITIGTQFNPFAWSFGLAYRLTDRWKIGMGSRYHPVLGWTPGVGIILE